MVQCLISVLHLRKNMSTRVSREQHEVLRHSSAGLTSSHRSDRTNGAAAESANSVQMQHSRLTYRVYVVTS